MILFPRGLAPIFVSRPPPLRARHIPYMLLKKTASSSSPYHFLKCESACACQANFVRGEGGGGKWRDGRRWEVEVGGELDRMCLGWVRNGDAAPLGKKNALRDPIGAYLRKVNMRFHFKNAVYGCMLAPPVNRGLGSNHRRRRRRRPIICRPRDRFGSPPPFPPLDPLGTHIQTAPFRRPSCQYTPRLVLGSGTHRKMCVVCCLLGGGTILSGERKQIRHEDMRCHKLRLSFVPALSPHRASPNK